MTMWFGSGATTAAPPRGPSRAAPPGARRDRLHLPHL